MHSSFISKGTKSVSKAEGMSSKIELAALHVIRKIFCLTKIEICWKETFHWNSITDSPHS